MLKPYGEGQKGLKAEDLESHEKLITSLGMKIPDGVVILTGIFFQIMKENGLTEKSSSKSVMDAECPECLVAINGEILEEMAVGVPYAIRSSALSERGGTGIYHTSFFVPTGNRDNDLKNLWYKEREVYASEFTPDAKAWREKNMAKIGMAVLIQQVKGYQFENCFLPQVAGVAYTSYQGLLTIRVVIGLGTKAVNGEGVIFNVQPDSALHFGRDIWDQESAACIDIATGELAEVDTHNEEVHCAIDYCTFCDLFQKLAELKKHGDFSLEWAIADDGITVVQCAPYEDKLPGDMNVDASHYFLFAEGSDVLHSGKAVCKGLVYVHGWSNNTASMLEVLNSRLKNYLLIVPQDALSNLARIGLDEETQQQKVQLGFHHFSNAGGVIEKQIQYTDEQKEKMLMIFGRSTADHSRGMGASHFQQLCTRSDILFLGTSFDSTPLLAIPGRMDYGEGIAVWEIESVMVVDGTKKQGYIYVAKQAQDHHYSPTQVDNWSVALRRAANQLGKQKKNESLSEHFYWAHYAIGNNDEPIGFDPFRLDPDIVEERGLLGIKEGVQAVLDNISLVELSDHEQGDLKQYLQELLSRL